MNFDKFLRYTIPGVISLLVFYFLTYLTNLEAAKRLSESDSTLGFIAVLVFVSGGLGAIYNIIYWAICHFFYYPLDHTGLFSSIKDKLIIKDSAGNIINNKISKRDAWSVFNTYWYSKTRLRSKLEAINPRVDRLSDVCHGLGTTLIGLILAILAWLIWDQNGICSNYLSIIVGLLIIVLTLWNYLKSFKMYQALLNTTFLSILDEDLNTEPKRSTIEIILIK